MTDARGWSGDTFNPRELCFVPVLARFRCGVSPELAAEANSGLFTVLRSCHRASRLGLAV